MDFQAKVTQFIGETSGTSKAGKPWKKKEWVVETIDQYPRKVKIQCFGDRADNIQIEVGKDYLLSVDLDSREYNGRWYTDVSVFRVTEINAPAAIGGHQGGSQPQGGFGTPSFGPQGGDFNGQPFTAPSMESDEDLPF